MLSSSGKITVAMPVYNCRDTVLKSIDSVLQQSWTGEIELLICDDGSTDGTYEFLSDLEREYDIIRLIRNERNMGRPVTRNHLLSEASGEFLTWLDADDEKYPFMLREQMYYLLEEERRSGQQNVVVFSSYHWNFPERDEFRAVKVDAKGDIIKSLLDGSFGAYLWLALGRTTVFRAAGMFDAELPRLQDLDMFLRLAGMGAKFSALPGGEPMCVYNKSDIGREARQVLESFAIIRRNHKFLIDAYGVDYSKELKSKHLHVARRFAKANEDSALVRKIDLQLSKLNKK